ncbi:MAG: hypothetical protein KY397_03805 [Gemmatimonadetes bacterium]|nr:hypothetical protein [Gemmatimonadota bacterium]
MTRARAPRAALALAAAVLLAACDGDAGPLDPARRVAPLELERAMAVGDGFAAGALDDALYASAQRHSPLAILLRRAAGVDEFAQPLIADPGFAIGDSGGRLSLVAFHPPRIERLPRGGPLVEPPPSGPYRNLGVPGALLVEALAVRSEATSILGNPFYDLVLRDRGTFAQQVAEADASLVLLWIGTSDVLSYVAVGGDPDLAPGLPTPGGTFAGIYERLLDAILETTDRVVLFTVPDVTLFPLVRTVQPFVPDPVTGERIAPLIGPDGQNLDRSDLVTLDALPLIAQGIGVPEGAGGTDEPLPGRVVLESGESALARTEILRYNETIRRLAEERRLPLVDIHALVQRLASDQGVLTDGIRLTTEWLVGQAFGLDGSHLTPKANGVVVNLVIDALNARYGSRIPHVRTADLPGLPLLRSD